MQACAAPGERELWSPRCPHCPRQAVCAASWRSPACLNRPSLQWAHVLFSLMGLDAFQSWFHSLGGCTGNEENPLNDSLL